jgi:hypothetical protein
LNTVDDFFLVGGKGGKGKGHGDEDDGGEGGGGSGAGTAHATTMYKNMNPENAIFVNLLVERAEVRIHENFFVKWRVG